jgi:hypothetical protein
MSKIYFFFFLVLTSLSMESSAQTTSTNNNAFPGSFLRRELSILSAERDSSNNSLRTGQCGNDDEDDNGGNPWNWGWNGGNCSSGNNHNDNGNGGNCSGGNDHDDDDDNDDDGEEDDDDDDNDNGNGGNCSGGNDHDDDDNDDDGDDDDDDDDNDNGNGGNCSGGNDHDDDDNDDDGDDEGDDDGEDDDIDNDDNNGGENGDESEDDEENNDGDNDDQEEDDNDGDGENGGGDDEGDNDDDGNGEENDEEEDDDATDDNGDDSDGDGDNGGDDNGDGGGEPIGCLGYQCPADFFGECGQSIDPSNTGAPIFNGGYTLIGYTDQIVSPSCPLIINRTWQFIDCNNLNLICVQSITIEDNVSPILSVENIISNNCEDASSFNIQWTDCSTDVVITTTEISNPNNPTDCNIDGFRTQTQGGWGSNPNGNNPGAYLHANFATAFPSGLTIGCENTLVLNSASAVTAFLPSGSTPSALPNGSLVNPGGTYNNVLAGQLVALTISLQFDLTFPSFGTSDAWLGDLVIVSGDFQGYTVSQIVEIANEVIGGCNTSFSFSQINQVLSSINENYVDGSINNGFVECPALNETVGSLPNGTGDCASVDYYTITATDACGNSTTQIATIIFEDTTAPVFDDAPIQVTISCDQEITPITATDNCSSSDVNVTFTESEFSGGCLPTIERVYTAVDACGNISTFTQYITVVDNQAPSISGLELFVALPCGSEIPSDEPVITDNCSDVEIEYTEESQGNACNQTIIRTWTAIDACGNSETFTQVIQISDDTSPVFTFIPENVTLYCGSEIPMVNATATDNCGEAFITFTDQYQSSNGSCQQIIRTFSATDICGNVSLASQTLTFIDDVNPVLSLYPENYVGVCGENIEVPTITATDNCTTNLQVYFSESTENVGCSVIITRIWSAFDDCGNTTIHEQVIELVDDAAPVISPVSEVTISCNQLPNLTIEAIDACGFVETNYEDQIIGSGCSYDIQRTWTASDACGNTSQVQQLIHVVDNQAPVFTFVPASFSLACGNLPAPQNPVVVDNCTNGIVPILTVEITGTPCQQIITRTWRAYDACGNMAIATQVVTIADNVAPVLVGVPPSVTLSCPDLPVVPTVTANDNCSGQVDVTFTETTTGEGCGFQVTRVWRAVDACGNERLATQNIYVNDNIAPTWTGVPADVTINCSDVLPELANPTASDNCTEILESFYYEFEESTSCGSVLHRNWVATDGCGNSSTATQRINISDTVAPWFTRTPPAEVTVSCGNIPAPIEVNAVDNCSAVAVSMTEQVLTGGCPYIIRRTYSAVDACGNVATFVQNIQVLDDVAPILNNVPGNTTINCGEEWPLYDVTAEDDCAGMLEVEINETVEVIDCSEILTRVYTATDLCGNEVTAIQIIEKLDTTAPVLSALPQDLYVTCENIPEADILTANDACQGDVAVIFEESIQSVSTETSTCVLTTAEAFFGDMALWLPGIQGLSVNYIFTPNNGSLTINESLGTAHITGEVQNSTNPDQRWIIDFHLNNKKNWTEWSAQGRSYKDDFNIAGDNYLNWDYYELDPSSQLIGAGTLAGSVLQITHAPSTYYYGFQVGVAANNRNTAYGMSGWIYYNGTVNGATVSGHGDFFAENNCCEEQIIERTWTAVDCAGNAQSHTQMIYVNAATVANQSIVVEQPTLKVNHTVDQNFALKFTVPSTDDVMIDLYDASGQIIRNVYNGFAEGDKTYEVTVKAPSVENAMYFFKLTTENHTIMQPALMLR